MSLFKSILVALLLTFFAGSAHSQWIQTLDGYGVNDLAVSGSYLFAGTQDGGVFLSTNNGANWTSVNSGLTSNIVRCLAVSGSNLFAGTNDGVFISNDNGTNWTLSNSGLGSEDAYSFTVMGANIFAGTGEGVFRSVNNGSNWEPSGVNGLFVQCLASLGGNLFAGTYDLFVSGIFLSTNNGINWTQSNSGLTDLRVVSLAASSTNIFAGTNDSGVFLSTNNGSNWTSVNSGLPRPRLAWALAASGTNLFVGLYGLGIFVSTNNGTNWTDVSSGLTQRSVQCFVVAGTNLFAGAVGGVWRRPLAEMVSVHVVSSEVPGEFHLSQNYPNPFNPATTIEFEIRKRSEVKLNIMNLLGQEFETLISEELSAGKYNTVWDASRYPSGVYLYRLEAGSFSQSRKLILLK